MNKTYRRFISAKTRVLVDAGLKKVPALNPMLFDFQHDIVRWALKKGRAAIFADCGLGKTPMQLEWARHIPGDVLILAPLAVNKQTVREGKKFGVKVNACRCDGDIKPGINIANYEMLDHFNPERFAGIVLDESSILKSYGGKIRNQIIDSFKDTPYKLACTATPAPNDHMELGNHAEFLGVMNRTEMLAMYFVHDGKETQKWRLKGHGQSKFWEWVSSWAVMIRKPSDLGYDDGKFSLPEIKIHRIEIETGASPGKLFADPAETLSERLAARRSTVDQRCERAAELMNGTKEPWLFWCNLNAEGNALDKLIDGAVQVQGSDKSADKEDRMIGFSDGKFKTMITKPKIAGFGMNWQHCSNVVFVGLSDSYEQYYQAIRRCWRFGQKKTVNCYIVTAITEGNVVNNIKRKEAEAEKMAKGMVDNMKDINSAEIKGTKRSKAKYKEGESSGEDWTLKLGDCVESLVDVKTGSIHYSVFSPPFASLYTYSNSDRDMGNCQSNNEFMEHFGFLIDELYRVIMPGRLVSFHCMNLPTSKVRDGYIGLRDFRGDMIRSFQERGFIYHSEVCIWKDPVIAMQRTKALGLLHKQLKKDSAMSRMGIADYVVTMRKPGENPERVTNTNDSFPVSVWQRYASPIWADIRPGDVLKYREARENDDERHICPLQLGVIRRCIELWTNEGDIVLSPFAGIGSEGYVALEMGRKFLGVELKKSYFDTAVKNLKIAIANKRETRLF